MSFWTFIGVFLSVSVLLSMESEEKGDYRLDANEHVHAQSCPTLCDPMDSSPPDSSVHGVLRQEFSSGKNTGVGCHFLLQESSQ